MPVDVIAKIDLSDMRGHGSPYDRGRADSYYRRPYAPHYYPEGTHIGERIRKEIMTAFELSEYDAGYRDNEEDGFFKEY